ncbi:MAG: hypothetical protein ACYCY2_09855 [Acidithiobacillus ferriphilus]
MSNIIIIIIIMVVVVVVVWQKVGDKHQLYNRKLRETPKAYSTAAVRMTHQCSRCG